MLLSWGATWFLPVGHFDLRHSTSVAETPSTALSKGGHTSVNHWARSWTSPSKRVAIEKQAHAMIKTKDLYSGYCPTGGCTHHLPFCCYQHSYVGYALVFNVVLSLT